MNVRFSISLAILVSILTVSPVLGQQRPDPDFDAKISNPTYQGNGPSVLFDQAHHNFHTASGRYKPFADLISNDGYTVVPNNQIFSEESLRGFHLLVIANALASNSMEKWWTSAFTDEECKLLGKWVFNGGSLLLIADHAPFGAGAEKLAAQFGVEMSKGVTRDPDNHDPKTNNPTFLLFSRDNHLLGSHPVTEGRMVSEHINRIVSFTGQSLKGPAGSVEFLKLGSTALDQGAPTEEAIRTNMAKFRADALKSGHADFSEAMSVPYGEDMPAAGRAQGIALSYGKGRVVVLGEAALLSAQISSSGVQFGMNRSDIDNRQLALNILHWLSRLTN